MKEGKKRSKKRLNYKVFALYFAIFAIVFIASGVVAESVGLSSSAQKVVEDILSNKGINPDEVENIDDTNLVVYEVKPLEGNSFFVVTASDKNFKKQQTSTPGLSRYVMDFGYNGAMTGDGFLRTAVGVETSPEKGYVMMRKGSITGISTNLESLEGSGVIYITLYINGEEVGFRNSFIVEGTDSGKVMNDYDVQSVGTVNYEQGDVISMYIESEGDILWKDVITRVEITEE